MRKKLLVVLSLLPFISRAQQVTDSTQIELQPIDLKVYFTKQRLLSVTTSAQVLSESFIQQQQPSTLITAMNTVPGIRMEERSPGSYRLAMRGSLLRSPFGIRNTKVYIDDFPLTDAGGNTYLNLIDPASIQSIHINKGPDGSIYGANSGGVIQIQPKGFQVNQNRTQLQLTAGSYGMFQEQLNFQRKINNQYQFSINQSYLRSDGYRDNSALDKKTLQTAHHWQYHPNHQLRIFALYSDVAYQTPGGLTLAQYEDNRRAARPTGGPNPSAEEQKAGIYNKTGYLGIANQSQLTEDIQLNVALFGSYTDLENPFITNYEFRKEKNIGTRTYLSYIKPSSALPWQMQVGFEGALGWNDIDNYDNNKGVKGDPQAIDELDNSQWNLFYRAQVNLLKNWSIEGSLGLNKYHISYNQVFPTANASTGKIPFELTWMPRVATSYVHNNMAWRASVAKGYSNPTLAEVRSSDNQINTDLQAEEGVNYEIGYKLKSFNNRFIVDLSAYHYHMSNGIIRQLNDSGAEYYVNSGEMKQQGVELALWAHLPVHNSTVFKSFVFNSAATYNHYRFGDYKIGSNDYTDNKITAVPDWIWTNSVQLAFYKNFDLNIYHNFTSNSPLNDANTVFADKFHSVQAKVSWGTHLLKTKVQLFFGVDNVLNEEYSLGNDLNAFGNRFFNAAPMRNYFGGLKLSI